MKKIVFLFMLMLAIISCTSQKKEASTETQNETVILTVDELMGQAENFADSEIIVKGTVMHVCQQGGKRCFLMGSNEDVIIRVEAGEDIGAFTQEQMGSELEIVGVFKEVKTEAEAHNPGEEHTEGVEDESNEAHQLIVNAQEEQEAEYYIEGVKATEIVSSESL